MPVDLLQVIQEKTFNNDRINHPVCTYKNFITL